MSPMSRTPLTIEHALLGFVRQTPRHGYDIYQALSDPAGLGLVWRLKQSQLYALLGKLEDRGYLESTLEPQEARPPRKVFHLTPDGVVALRRWVSTPVDHGRSLRLEFLAKLYFARQEGEETAVALIAAQKEACRRWLAAQREQADAARERPYDWLVHQFRLGQIEAMLTWLETCAESVNGVQ